MRRPQVTADDGATSVEYGLVAAFVGIVFVAAGPSLYGLFLDVFDAILDGML